MFIPRFRKGDLLEAVVAHKRGRRSSFALGDKLVALGDSYINTVYGVEVVRVMEDWPFGYNANRFKKIDGIGVPW